MHALMSLVNVIILEKYLKVILDYTTYVNVLI